MEAYQCRECVKCPFAIRRINGLQQRRASLYVHETIPQFITGLHCITFFFNNYLSFWVRFYICMWRQREEKRKREEARGEKNKKIFLSSLSLLSVFSMNFLLSLCSLLSLSLSFCLSVCVLFSFSLSVEWGAIMWKSKHTKTWGVQCSDGFSCDTSWTERQAGKKIRNFQGYASNREASVRIYP